MSMRKYNGSPIDMTWSNGPWANDGETVGSSDEANASGKITTEMEDKDTNKEPTWPGNDASKSEQARFIRRMLLGGSGYDGIHEAGYGSCGKIKQAAEGTGVYKGVECEIPPIEHTTGNAVGEWVIQDEHIQETQEQETETETEPTLDGQSVSKGYTPREPTTTDNTKRNAVIATVALLISYLLGKRGGN